MATELDTRCPICLDSWVNPSYAVPCLHRFCFACIQRWAESKPECPLCKRRVSSIVHSVRADNSFKELVIPPPAEALISAHFRQSVFTHYQATALQAGAASLLPRALVGGQQSYISASLFREHRSVFQPLLPWLHQELGQMFGDNHQVASGVESLVFNLSLFDLAEEHQMQLLQPCLQRHRAGFVRRLIAIAVEQRNEMAHHVLHSHAARRQEGSSAASLERNPAPGVGPSSSFAVSSTRELFTSFSNAFLRIPAMSPALPASAANLPLLGPVAGRRGGPAAEPRYHPARGHIVYTRKVLQKPVKGAGPRGPGGFP